MTVEKALEAIANTLKSNISNKAKLNWIEVIARESVEELSHEADKYRPGDVVKVC